MDVFVPVKSFKFQIGCLMEFGFEYPEGGYKLVFKGKVRDWRALSKPLFSCSVTLLTGAIYEISNLHN